MDLFEYQAHARRTDPKESHLAAESVRLIGQAQALILDLLETYGPMHDEEIFRMFPGCITESGCRTRRSELVSKGAVIDSGLRALTKSGRKSICWKAV